MSLFDQLSSVDQARLETAAEWFIRLQDDRSVEMSAEFCEWIASPLNRHAFESVSKSMAALDHFRTTPKILDMRGSALRHMRDEGRPQMHRRLVLKGAVAAAVVGLVGGAALYFKDQGSKKYATDVGEKRVVALDDGSRILMDASSEVRVRYSDSVRDIAIDRGRARFDVAHDVGRPFIVSAGGERVIAVGTAFNIEQLKQKVVVTLLQGHVVVKHMPRGDLVDPVGSDAISLVSGQQLIASSDGKSVVSNVDLNTAEAWETGRLVFRDVPLSEAVEQVNRYTDHPVAVGSSVARISISGVFDAGDIGAFVSGVTGYFPVQAVTDGADRIMLMRRS